jgi:methyltransferase (TIGR00027 family)
MLKDARVFEVDRATTQEIKQRRAAEVLGAAPPNLTWVPIDFRHDNLSEVLTRAGFDSSQKSFFIWEGVTMYLTEQAVRDTLGFVATLPAGSSIVFDYVYAETIVFLNNMNIDQMPEAMRGPFMRLRKLESGEPWIFGLPANNERDFVNKLGLNAGEILPVGGDDAVRRYLTRSNGDTFVARPTTAAPQRSFYFMIEASVS